MCGRLCGTRPRAPQEGRKASAGRLQAYCGCKGAWGLVACLGCRALRTVNHNVEVTPGGCHGVARRAKVAPRRRERSRVLSAVPRRGQRQACCGGRRRAAGRHLAAGVQEGEVGRPREGAASAAPRGGGRVAHTSSMTMMPPIILLLKKACQRLLRARTHKRTPPPAPRQQERYVRLGGALATLSWRTACSCSSPRRSPRAACRWSSTPSARRVWAPRASQSRDNGGARQAGKGATQARTEHSF